MKSAHSLTESNVASDLSTKAVYLRHLGSVASKLRSAAVEVGREARPTSTSIRVKRRGHYVPVPSPLSRHSPFSLPRPLRLAGVTLPLTGALTYPASAPASVPPAAIVVVVSGASIWPLLIFGLVDRGAVTWRGSRRRDDPPLEAPSDRRLDLDAE